MDLEVIRAASGMEALQCTERDEFAVILMDVQMPDMDGFETVKRMRTQVNTKAKETPVIFISAIYSEHYYLNEGIGTEAVDFISKPLNRLLLLSKVRVFVKLYEQRVQLEQQKQLLEEMLEKKNVTNARLSAEILERKQLQEQALKLSKTVEQSPVSVVISDTKGTIEYVNPKFCDLTGFSPQEVLGENVRFLKSESQPAASNALWPTITQGGVWRGEFHNRKQNGDPFWEKAIISAISNEEGVTTHYLAVKEDITEIKIKNKALLKAKQLAEEANRSKSEFLANMSHEIRTPMNAIIGMTDLVLESDLDAEQRENLEIVSSSSESLLALLNDILDFSKIESGKLEILEVEFNLSQELHNIIDILKIQAKNKGIELELEVDLTIPSTVKGDSLRLRQVLINLAGNAIKFTEKGGVKINVKAIEHSKTELLLEFCVQDSGIGISEDRLKHIFDSFTQVDATITRQYGGTGLGLTISQKLIGLMGGEIHVKSTPGEGSCFFFRLPLRPGHFLKKKKKAPSKFPADYFEGVEILLVEDNPVNQKLAVRILQKSGIHVKHAWHGLEALDMLGKYDFDLVLMDIQMPKMSGIEATEKIRSGEVSVRDPHIPIIAMTANAMQGDREKCLDIGMNDYVTKPINKVQLFDVIARYKSDQH